MVRCMSFHVTTVTRWLIISLTSMMFLAWLATMLLALKTGKLPFAGKKRKSYVEIISQYIFRLLNLFFYRWLSCRTWATEITKDKDTDGTDEFCAREGEYECVSPNMPSCEDRTVICDLTQIKEKEGMILIDNSANNTRDNGSYLAKFSYSCQQEGNHIPNYHTMIHLNIIPIRYDCIFI